MWLSCITNDWRTRSTGGAEATVDMWTVTRFGHALASVAVDIRPNQGRVEWTGYDSLQNGGKTTGRTVHEFQSLSHSLDPPQPKDGYTFIRHMGLFHN